VADLAGVRSFALSLPGATEEPHFEMTSFRVRGRIFATVPPDETRLHVFVGETDIDAYVAEDPGAFEPLLWGQKVRGIRVLLAAAPQDRVQELLTKAWRRKAPKQLVAEHDTSDGEPRTR